MLQKAFGFCEAQTAQAFFKIILGGGGGEEKKKEKRKKGMREEGRGFLLRRHRHLLPAQRQRAARRAGRSLPASPLLHHVSPSTKAHLLRVWAAVTAWGARWPRRDGIARPPSPAGSAPQPAAQMWSGPAAGAGPGAGTGGRQPCSGGLPHTPFAPWVSASGQTT